MLTVLIMDDEYYFREVIRQYFREWENEYILVGEAKNGREGMALVEELKPDILLVDINMPQKGGLEVLEEIYQKKIKAKVMILTGYSEFVYAQNAIRFGVQQYLLKPIDKQALKRYLDETAARIQTEQDQKRHLIKAVQDQQATRPIIREYLTNRILHDENWNTTLEMAMNYIDLQEFCTCQVILTNVWNPEANRMNIKENPVYRYDQDESLLRFISGNVLTELLDQKGLSCMIGFENQYMCVIASGKFSIDRLTEKTAEVMQAFQSFMNQKLGLAGCVCIGSAYQTLQEVRKSYQEALAVKQYMNLYSKEGIISYCELAKLNETPEEFYGSRSRQLKSLLRSRRQDELLRMIDELVNEMTEVEMAPNIVYHWVNDIIACIFEYSHEGENCIQGYSEHCSIQPPRIHDCSFGEIRENLVKYTVSILEASKEKEIKKQQQLPEAIMQYIEDNYYKEIFSLQEISRELGISKSVLCRKFREAMNMTIGEYLISFRMRKAKEMMDDGFTNVAFVGEECGYKDAGYFSRCFKKNYGISPSHYIKSL